jgi:hypothetical protein
MFGFKPRCIITFSINLGKAGAISEDEAVTFDEADLAFKEQIG